MYIRNIRCLIQLYLTLLLAACGGNSNPESNPPQVDNDDIEAIASGLDQRPDNTSCVAPERPFLSSQIETLDAFPNLPSLSQPTKMILEPCLLYTSPSPRDS